MAEDRANLLLSRRQKYLANRVEIKLESARDEIYRTYDAVESALDAR